MSLHVLEFNDAGLRLSDASGVLLSSPGYAHVTSKEIEFGESARKQSKVHPLSSFNQFWHKLSLDPFSKLVGSFRHNADIAFSHLQEIATSAQLTGDVILAVPGSFSREQMAILLGLLKQTPMRPVALVDAALMAAVHHADQDSVIHVDLQLHQVVLSKLKRVDAQLKRESVILVPGAGWVNVSENLMQLFTSAFIAQCRFNPQHNAASEQMLLDNLPQWLVEEQIEDSDDDVSVQESRRSLQIKLSHNALVHQASLPRSALHNRLVPFFQKIQQQLAVIDPHGDTPLLISDRMQFLPGFQEVLASRSDGGSRQLSLLSAQRVAQSCFHHQDLLLGSPDALQFVSAISTKTKTPAVSSTRRSEVHAAPTHLLFKHQARSLTNGLLIGVSRPKNDIRLIRKDLQEDSAGLQVLGEIIREDGHFVLRSTAIAVNGMRAEAQQILQLGDSLSGTDISHPIELIRVQEHDD